MSSTDERREEDRLSSFSSSLDDERAPHTPQPTSGSSSNATTTSQSVSRPPSSSFQHHFRSISSPDDRPSPPLLRPHGFIGSPSPFRLDPVSYDRRSNATTPDSPSSASTVSGRNINLAALHNVQDDPFTHLRDPVDELAGRTTPFHFWQHDWRGERTPPPADPPARPRSRSMSIFESNGVTSPLSPPTSSILGQSIWSNPPPPPPAPTQEATPASSREGSRTSHHHASSQVEQQEAYDLGRQTIGLEWAPTLANLTNSTLELTNRVGILSDMSLSLRERVAALEYEKTNSDRDLDRLRAFIQNALVPHQQQQQQPQQQQQQQQQQQPQPQQGQGQQRPVLSPLRPPTPGGGFGGFNERGQQGNGLKARAQPFTPLSSRHHTPTSSIGSLAGSIGPSASSHSFYGSSTSSMLTSPIVSQKSHSISNFGDLDFGLGSTNSLGLGGVGEAGRNPFDYFGAGPATGTSSPTSAGGPLSGDILGHRHRSRVSEPGPFLGGASGGNPMPPRDRGRDRGASLSAIMPITAQAQWMAKQPSFEQINYRALLENETDIDDEAFVRRVINQNDQQCSLFLQQRVRNTSSEVRRRALFSAVGKFLLPLSVSKFGNFLVSRCLEHGGSELAAVFTQKLTGRFLELALDHAGCHVVQRLLDYGGQITKTLVVSEMMDQPMTLTSKNACHCWNRLLSTSNPPEFYDGLARTGRGLWTEIIKEEGGSLVCQHTLEDWPGAHTSVIARELFDQMEQIATSSCGSFVLSTLLDRNALPFRAKLMEAAPRLALDSFGAKVLEKAIRTGKIQAPAVASFVETICKSSNDGRPPLLLEIASHANGAQLINVLLTGGNSASYDGRMMIARTASKHASVLKNAPHGQRVWNICQAMSLRG